MGSELTGESRTAFDDLQRAAAEKMNDAAAEGQRDLDTAKDASAGYLGQARTMAENVVTSAQVRSQRTLCSSSGLNIHCTGLSSSR